MCIMIRIVWLIIEMGSIVVPLWGRLVLEV